MGGTRRLVGSSGAGSHGYRLGAERDMSADSAFPNGCPNSGVTVTLVRFGQENKMALKMVSARLVVSSFSSLPLCMYAGMKP